MTIEFKPRQKSKERMDLATVPMPTSPDLKEGERNELSLGLSYLKDGMGRQGRGFYLVATGHSTNGIFQSHLLMQDPSHYILVASAKRFSAKTLRELTDSVPTEHLETIEKLVAQAEGYYENKGKAA